VNKSDLIDVIADRLGKTKKETSEVVEAVIDQITRSVASGEKVSLSGFGVFEKQSRAARVGRNPRTGATVKIKATSVPKFRAGVDFKLVVSGKKRPAKRTATKKAAPAARKTTTKKAAPAARKTTVKKAAPAARKTTTARKTTAKKAPAKRTARR
jgi:DNA-binding protein HU-beta